MTVHVYVIMHVYSVLTVYSVPRSQTISSANSHQRQVAGYFYCLICVYVCMCIECMGSIPAKSKGTEAKAEKADATPAAGIGDPDLNTHNHCSSCSVVHFHGNALYLCVTCALH